MYKMAVNMFALGYANLAIYTEMYIEIGLYRLCYSIQMHPVKIKMH